MEEYLYEDLYQLEETHWWHKAKRAFVTEAVKQCLRDRIFAQKKTSPSAHAHAPHSHNAFNASSEIQLLDIGCGTGKNLEELSHLLPAAGIDMSSAALKFCRARGLQNVAHADSYTIPYNKNTLKIVTLLDVLEHTEDDKTLAEIWRVLEPNGFLIITVPALPWLWSNWDVVLHHYRRYTTGSLKEVLEKHGFQSVHLSYAYSFLVLPVILVRWLKSFLPAQNYNSDFKINMPIVNHIFLSLSAIERWFVWHTGVPFGTSIFAIAQKVDHEKTKETTHLTRRSGL